jgi:hypothetical protein
MFCTYCKAARPNNEAPCPNCGAPSPVTAGQAPFAGNTNGVPWGGPGVAGGPGVSFKEQWEQQQVPQLSFDNQANNNPWRSPSGQLGAPNTNPWQQSPASQQMPMPSWQQPSGQLADQANPMPSWQQPSGQLADQANPMPSWQQPSGQLADQANPMPSWQQTGAQNATQEPLGQSGQQNMLPVPYKGGSALEPAGRQPTISLQLVPEQAISHLLPAEPLPAPDIVHVAPMYTKPRPIIPKKRAVNGLISVIVVSLLLCVAAGYAANATGIWGNIVSFYTGKPVSNIATQNVNIPAPAQPIPGPAYNNIPSAALASRIDSNNQPIEQKDTFSPGQTFYVTFSVQPDKGKTGVEQVKWYTNNNLFQPSKPISVPYQPSKTSNFKMSMMFPTPVSGKVELYWNGKLAETLFFAVR